MSLFPRNFYDDDVSFAPVFRFIDAFDNWNTHSNKGQSLRQQHRVPSFNPKFDVVETKSAYELHGEIPGVDKKDISIEFTEPQTLVVHGRVERNYTSGTPPAGLVEGFQSGAGAITDGSKTPAPSSPTSESHRATVTDEATEAAKERGTPTAEDNKQVAGPATKNGEVAHAPSSRAKFWCQERSIGEFHRTFNFPASVDEAGVKASLDNGILRITIPKQEKRTNRRVEVS